MLISRWNVIKHDEDVCKTLARELHISPLLAILLFNRGITTVEEAKDFLSPSLANLSSPFNLLNMGAAVEKIWAYIDSKEKIVVYGDYDVDGICASVILYSALENLGAAVDYYVPDRIEEGYGMNQSALENIVKSGAKLLITVDCGISSAQEVALAKEMGLDVIVTDHHQLPEVLPDCIIVNPCMHLNAKENWSYLCGAGVSFKLVMALYEWRYGEKRKEEVLDLTDLVALATVADIVPLLGDNRILVKAGLEQMEKQGRAGLAALYEIAGLSGEITTETVGFGLAPRINACGRIGDVSLGIRLLLTKDKEEAWAIAQRLDSENRNRQNIEREIYDEALQLIAQKKNDLRRGLVLSGENWHPGVIGIVASRIVEKFYTPTIVLTKTKEGIYKGSGRSIQGFHLQQALAKCADVLETYGGHAQAAGLSVKEENLERFTVRFGELVAQCSDELFLPEIKIDCVLKPESINYHLYNEINTLRPFGMSNPAPMFALRGQAAKEVRIVGAGGEHLRIKIQGSKGDIMAIGFKKAYLEDTAKDSAVDIAFNLNKNVFNNRTSLQLLLKDMKPYKRRDDMGLLDRLFFYWQEYLDYSPYRGIAEADEFYTKIVGVSFDNRQEKIALLSEGEEVFLRRDPQNDYDKNAIAVCSQSDRLGYLKRELARELAGNLDKGIVYKAKVSDITGDGKEHRGVNIFISRKLRDKGIVYDELRARKNFIRRFNDEKIKKAIRRTVLKNNDYREKQTEALKELEQGKNVLCIMGTGRGKSAIFASFASYTALKKDKITIIVYPLRSLINDQYFRMESELQNLGLRVMRATGELLGEERTKFFHALEYQRVDIVLTTPEFLMYNEENFAKFKDNYGLMVIDEAHHLTKGRAGYRFIPSFAKKMEMQILALTATASDETARGIVEKLSIDALVIDNHIRTNLHLDDRRKERDKLKWLIELVSRGEKVIVYVNSRRQAVDLAQALRERNALKNYKDKIAYYHGGLSSSDRRALEDNFRHGILTCIITTSAFGEGMDISDVSHVVLYHLSFSLEEFNQLAGRCGRNGKDAYIHLLYNERDKRLNELILEGNCPKRETLAQFYKGLKRFANNGVIEATNQELAEGIKNIEGLSADSVSHWIGIFEELDFLNRERNGNHRKIFLNENPVKTDLERSLRYQEGIAERQDYDQYLQLAFADNLDMMLEAVNQPIYPKEDIDELLGR